MIINSVWREKIAFSLLNSVEKMVHYEKKLERLNEDVKLKKLRLQMSDHHKQITKLTSNKL